MVKFICHFSFISHYVENFYSDDNRDSAALVNRAITFSTNDEKILLVDTKTVNRLKDVYASRPLVLDTVLDLCNIINLDAGDELATLARMASVTRITDPNTFVLNEDAYIHAALHSRGINVLNSKAALEHLEHATPPAP